MSHPPTADGHAPVPSAAPPLSSTPRRALVVGGGITGLVAAHALARRGWQVALCEAGDEVGGAIRTTRTDGWIVEAGPNTLLLRDRTLDPLFDELGLADRLLVANPAAAKRFVVRQGRPWPLPTSPWQAVTTPLFRLPGKLRVLLEPFVRRNRTDPDETLASFARRRVGQEFLDWAVNPFVGGVYACAPEDLVVRHALPRLWRLEQEHGSLVAGSLALLRQRRRAGPRPPARLVSFRDGLAELPRTLAAALGPAVRTDTRVEELERAAGHWQVRGSRGDGTSWTLTAEAVLLATDAAALGRIAVNQTHPLATLAALPYSSVTSVALGFPRDAIEHPLDGFGMLVPHKEGRTILGTLFSSTLFPGRAPEGQVLLTTFVGGRQPEIAALPDAELVELVQDELVRLLGVRSAPGFRQITRWPRAIPRYGPGFAAHQAALDAFEAAHPGLFVAGHVRDGVSLPDCIAAGVRAAERISGGDSSPSR
jgi:oxygen-dependent protoporphyrinogen oxidase